MVGKKKYIRVDYSDSVFNTNTFTIKKNKNDLTMTHKVVFDYIKTQHK